MNSLEEILALDDINQKIQYLKKGRRTHLPNASALLSDWDSSKHEIMWNKVKYPDRKVKTQEEKQIFDEKSGKTRIEPEKVEDSVVNRISIPLEQDIVNIQTAFTVGIEPSLDCTPDDGEKNLFEALKSVLNKNKIKYQNKKIVRSWLSEQDVAEYWYVSDDDSFWPSFIKRIKAVFGVSSPNKKLKSVVWSPFRGDKLYPFFDEYGDLVAFSREYKKKNLDDVEITVFMTVTKDSVYQWEMDKLWTSPEGKTFKHGLPKLPVIYSYRPEAYCEKIKTFRVRLEKLLSNYADCIDYHFFPILKLIGDVEGFSGKTKDRVVKLTGNGADAQYLTWEQATETVKLELDKLFNMAYDMTNTPRISFEEMKGIGQVSGIAMRLMFMGAHMSVSNHGEVIGEFMQRRINFLVSALGTINTSLESASKTIEVSTDLVPYMIDSKSDDVEVAVSAVQGGIWSTREGIMFAGNADRVEEELKEIKEEQNEKVQTNTKISPEQNTGNNKV